MRQAQTLHGPYMALVRAKRPTSNRTSSTCVPRTVNTTGAGLKEAKESD
jgi:hypothetical protein